jgi:hypothetical protein
MVVTTRTNTAPGFHAMPAASYSGWDTQNRCLARQAVTRTGAADFLLFRLRVDRDPAQRFVRMIFFSIRTGASNHPAEDGIETEEEEEPRFLGPCVGLARWWSTAGRFFY